jgi:hypothetical protein
MRVQSRRAEVSSKSQVRLFDSATLARLNRAAIMKDNSGNLFSVTQPKGA